MKDFSDKEVVIEVNNLTKDYGFGRGVFDVSFKIHKGECFGYLGPNGAGKSTTIRHIMGFSKPTVGSIKIFGIESFNNTDKFLKNVGYLPGEPSLPLGLNGMGFLRMMQDMRGERNDERLNYLLDLFKLNPNVEVNSMSLGEKRKLAVVAAFMNDPEVLILDEPTSGLDPIMQQVFISFILEEKKRGKTILLSSHIFSEVDATCDTISIIKDGKHVSTFSADDLKARKTLEYILHFDSLESYTKFLNRKEEVKTEDEKIVILSHNEKAKTINIEVNRRRYKHLFRVLLNQGITEFEEKPFTLQDYFMSFYKEERTFGGLEGVKGNSKEGLKTEDKK